MERLKSISKEAQQMIMAYVVLFGLTYLPFIWCSANAQGSLTYLGIACTVELCVFIYMNTKISGRLFSFSTVFVAVLFVFSFGQVMIHTYFQGIYDHVRFLNLLLSSEALFGFLLINASFVMICIGILFAEALQGNRSSSEKKQGIESKCNWNKCIWVVICLTFPVKLIIDAYCVYVSFTQGGPAAREWINQFPNVFLYFGKISLVGIALLLVNYKEKPKHQFAVFACVEFYILLMMLSGIRSENVSYLLIFALIYLMNIRKKIPVYGWILCGIGGFLALSFVVAAGNFRLLEEKSAKSFLEVFVRAITKDNVFFTLLDHMGDTAYTAQCVINKWLHLYKPTYGKSYVLGSMAILPNIPGVTDLPGRLTEASCFAIQLQKAGTLSEGYLNIGGSLIGELFFNFGYVGGVLMSGLVGLLIGWTSSCSSRWFEEKKYAGLIVTVPMMFATVYWVRNYYGGGIREVVWAPVFFCLVLCVLNMKRERVCQLWRKLVCLVKR